MYKSEGFAWNADSFWQNNVYHQVLTSIQKGLSTKIVFPTSDIRTIHAPQGSPIIFLQPSSKYTCQKSISGGGVVEDIKVDTIHNMWHSYGILTGFTSEAELIDFITRSSGSNTLLNSSTTISCLILNRVAFFDTPLDPELFKITVNKYTVSRTKIPASIGHSLINLADSIQRLNY